MNNFENGEISNQMVTPRTNFFQGYDKSPALSFDKVTSLTNGTVIGIIGFYIGGINYNPSDKNSDNSAISFTKELKKQYLTKVKLAYLYVGRSDQGVSNLINKNDTQATNKGITDAQEAEKLAKALDIPKDNVIYLDIEGGALHNDKVVEYAKSWVNYINNKTDYWAGIYCSAGSNCETAKQLYDGVEKKANMYVAKWMADSGYCYNMFTGETYKTSYANPAKWYDIDPTEAVPDVGCVVRQYSGNVYISLKGVETIVDQISSIVANPSEKQFS